MPKPNSIMYGVLALTGDGRLTCVENRSHAFYESLFTVTMVSTFTRLGFLNLLINPMLLRQTGKSRSLSGILHQLHCKVNTAVREALRHPSDWHSVLGSNYELSSQTYALVRGG